MTGITTKIAAASLVALTAAVAGGCSSNSGGGQAEPPQAMIQSSGQTAPADLQLLCASEAATRLGVDSTKVLPVSSGLGEPGTYRVDLNVDGGQAVCVIAEGGEVLSVDPVG